MKFIKDKNLLKNIAHQIDMLNTLGGGICQTNVQIDKREKGAIIKVSAPSVPAEAFKIMLNQNKLTVFATLPQTSESGLIAPLFHQEFILPAHVALDRVKAVYKGSEIQVRLPFFESYTRQIDIETEI